MGDTLINASAVVRKAVCDDIAGVMEVACSEGKSNKDYRSGFLMDDYNSDYNYFYKRFHRLIDELRHFYVIENGMILGFLIAYDRKEWLMHNSKWLDDIIWSPVFDKSNTDRFVIVDKAAILSGLTGRGLGSRLYCTLIQNIKDEGINNMFAETIISPLPNFASLEFRLKQKYALAGVRYETYKDKLYTDLVYHKQV